MERLISLFREADYEQWSPSQSQRPPPRQHEEPLYFQQLLEYLRQEKGVENEEADDDIDVDADVLAEAVA